MKQCRVFISVLAFVLSFCCCKAQEGDKYVYQDSSSLSQDSVSVKVEAQSVDPSTLPTTTVADTVLYYNSLTISPDSIERLKNSKSFAYARDLDSLLKALKKKPTTEKTKPDDRSDWLEKILSSSATKVVLWSLAGLFVLFVMYKLLVAEGVFMKSSIKNRVKELREEEIDTGQLEYGKLIAQAINEKNYRLAIRYLYLQLLQELSDNELVKLVADKTNYQYANELTNTIYREEFLWLTLNYEYAWYGEFDLNEETFTQLQNSFNQFNNRLQNS